MITITVPLSEMCSFRHGGTPSKSNPEFWSGDIPWVSPKDMKTTLLLGAQDSITLKGVEGSATSLVPTGSILTVVRSGILAHSVPFALAGRPVTFNQDIKAIQVTDDRVTNDYVYWFLRSKEPEILARGVKKGATVHSLQSGFLEGLAIPILPRTEQQRIVDLLSRTENILCMRREAEQKAKEIIPALFLDMFGDPSTNPKGWKVRHLQTITLAVIDCPHSTPKFAEEGVLCLRTTNLGIGNWQWSERRYVSEGDYLTRTARGRLEVGDIIISREGTLGIGAIVRPEMRLCMGQRLVQIRADSRVVTAEYLLWYLLDLLSPQSVEKHLAGSTSKHLNLSLLRTMAVPVPPLELQERFAALTMEAQGLVESQRQGLDNSQDTLQSLLAGVFGGG
jgi:type I restriction enzyme S subunit